MEGFQAEGQLDRIFSFPSLTSKISILFCFSSILFTRSSRRNGNKVSGSVVQDDEEGHLIFSIGDILQNRYIFIF